MVHLRDCPSLVRRLMLLALCAGTPLLSPALSGADLDQPVNVPDEIGLGERLALITWLQEHRIPIADPQNIKDLRAAYLKATTASSVAQVPSSSSEELDALRTKIWVRHGRNLAATSTIDEARQLLADLDKEQEERHKALTDELLRRSRASVKPAASKVVSAPSSAAGTATANRRNADSIDPQFPAYPSASWQNGSGYCASIYRLRRDIFLDPLKAYRPPFPEWMPDAVQYIDMTARIGYSFPLLDFASMNPAKRLIAANCQDPGTRYRLWSHEHTQNGEQVFNDLTASHFPAIIRIQMAEEMCVNAAGASTPAGRDVHIKYRQIAKDLGLQLMHEPMANPWQEHLLAARLCQMGSIFYPKDHHFEWIEAYNNELVVNAIRGAAVKPWLAEMLKGSLHVMKAWRARGNGLAKNVPANAWPEFNDQLEIAKGHFEKALAIDPKQPLAFAMLISVAMGQSSGSTEILALLDRSIAICPDFIPAYDMAFEALHPRWGGSDALLQELAKRGVQTNDFTSMAPNYLFKVLDHGPPSPILSYPKNWNLVKSVQEGYIASPAFADVRSFHVTNYLRLAHYYEKYEDATAVIRAYPQDVHMEFFANMSNIDRTTAERVIASYQETGKPPPRDPR